MNERSKIPCRHFEECGGCSLQHLSKSDYLGYKQNILNNIVNHIGVSQDVVYDLVEVPPKNRRRVELKISVSKGKVSVGFFASKSHDVVAIQECPVSRDEVVNFLQPLKSFLESLNKPGIVKAFSITVLENGLDTIISLSSKMKSDDKNKLIDFAKNSEILRLSEQVEDELIECLYDEKNSSINFAGVEVSLPVGAFLQATSKGQKSITKLVLEHLGKCDRVADLYSGCGTYSFPLTEAVTSVAACEGDEQMVVAMHNAITKNNLDERISVTVRDIFKNPLTESELKNFDGVVINPPRNGAMPQIKKLANSSVSKIAMVSCNPSTFERDAKHLVNRGYKMIKAVPIDQFLWSNHLEIVALFER